MTRSRGRKPNPGHPFRARANRLTTVQHCRRARTPTHGEATTVRLHSRSRETLSCVCPQPQPPTLAVMTMTRRYPSCVEDHRPAIRQRHSGGKCIRLKSSAIMHTPAAPGPDEAGWLRTRTFSFNNRKAEGIYTVVDIL